MRTLLLGFTLVIMLAACSGEAMPTATLILTPTPAATFAATQPIAPGVAIGPVVVTTELDPNGCAANAVSRLPEDTQTFYVVAEQSDIPIGTEVFVRLYRNGEVVSQDQEQPITADRTYENICLFFNFEFDPNRGFFRRGEYTAQFFVDGTAAARADFIVE